MSQRHVFDDHTTLVFRGLKGVVARHPNLSLIPDLKVVFDAAHDKSKVSLISGGGSGHEPFGASYVGQGLLTASASGDIFASPSARQVYGAIRSIPSDKGTILIITQYTGDLLHFSLACQQARADGISNVEIVPVGDDVSVGRKAGGLVGRRALAGVMLVCKLAGAASEADWSFQECLDLTRASANSLVSVSALLDHASVPGRSEFGAIPENTVEIGVGLHNEPGFFVVQPQPHSSEFIKRMLRLLLDPEDVDRAYVPFSPNDEVVLLCNNQGGMSTLEMNTVVDETLLQLEQDWRIKPVRTYEGAFVTTLNAPGFSLSLLNLSRTASLTAKPRSQLLDFLDASHGALAWPGANAQAYADETLAKRTLQQKLVPTPSPAKVAEEDPRSSQVLRADPDILARAVTSAAEAAYAAEPDLTRMDTIVGDGDCGETVALGAQAVLKAVQSGLCASGDVVKLLRDLTTLIDDSCGGTLGAILSIYLAAVTSETRTWVGQGGCNFEDTPWGKICMSALATLQKSTAARKGMRTVMDAIIPLAEELSRSGSFLSAVKACRAGADATVTMKAKLGRATYVGERKDQTLPPDPGAQAFAVTMEGLLAGLEKNM